MLAKLYQNSNLVTDLQMEKIVKDKLRLLYVVSLIV